MIDFDDIWQKYSKYSRIVSMLHFRVGLLSDFWSKFCLLAQNSILAYFEYFCQMSSKSILIILSYIVSKLTRFFETQCTVHMSGCVIGDLLSFAQVCLMNGSDAIATSLIVCLTGQFL